jgi:hypothetical protein
MKCMSNWNIVLDMLDISTNRMGRLAWSPLDDVCIGFMRGSIKQLDVTSQ